MLTITTFYSTIFKVILKAGSKEFWVVFFLTHTLHTVIYFQIILMWIDHSITICFGFINPTSKLVDHPNFLQFFTNTFLVYFHRHDTIWQISCQFLFWPICALSMIPSKILNKYTNKFFFIAVNSQHARMILCKLKSERKNWYLL